MTNKITADLFTNSAFTKAFRASLKNPTQKVVFNGVSWKVGNQEFKISEAKLHTIRSCFLKIGHKLRMHCSYKYCKSYKKCVRKFETAQFQDWPKAVASSAKLAHEVMKKHAYFLKDLPENIENKKSEIAQCIVQMEQAKLSQQLNLVDSPEVKKIFEEIKLLEELKGLLNVYIDQRIKRNNPVTLEAIGGAISGFFNNWIPNANAVEEVKLSPQLNALASGILDSIPLDAQNPQNQLPFKNKIAEEVKAKLIRGSQIVNGFDLSQYENYLRTKQEQLQQLQNERANAPEIITNYAASYKAPELFLSPPQSPLKRAHQKMASKTEKGPPLESFFNELKVIVSPNMYSLWESLISNLVGKYGDEVVQDFGKQGNKLQLVFKKPLKLFMLACNSKGVEDAKFEPEGGSILNFDKTITFTPASKSRLNITGLKSWARIPKKYEWAKIILGEYAQVDLTSMETKKEIIRGKPADVVTITAFKQLGLIKREIPRTSRVSALVKHWKDHGEIVDKDDIVFLRAKRAAFIKEKKIEQ